MIMSAQTDSYFLSIFLILIKKFLFKNVKTCDTACPSRSTFAKIDSLDFSNLIELKASSNSPKSTLGAEQTSEAHSSQKHHDLIRHQAIQCSCSSSNISFEHLFTYFDKIKNNFSMYEDRVERQILKYKLRKMSALYSVSDEERLKLYEMFYTRMPDLVVSVLVESPNHLINDDIFKSIVGSHETPEVAGVSNVNFPEHLLPQISRVTRRLLPLTQRQEALFEEMIREKEIGHSLENISNVQAVCHGQRKAPLKFNQNVCVQPTFRFKKNAFANKV